MVYSKDIYFSSVTKAMNDWGSLDWNVTLMQYDVKTLNYHNIYMIIINKNNKNCDVANYSLVSDYCFYIRLAPV